MLLETIGPSGRHPLHLSNSLLSSNPDFAIARLSARRLHRAQLELPYLQPVIAPIASAGDQIKGPTVLGTCDAGAQHNAKILNVEWRSV